MLYSDILNAINLFLYHKQMTSESLRNGETFACAGFIFTLIWNKKVFVFDSHSQDRNGCHVPNGQ